MGDLKGRTVVGNELIQRQPLQIVVVDDHPIFWDGRRTIFFLIDSPSTVNNLGIGSGLDTTEELHDLSSKYEELVTATV